MNIDVNGISLNYLKTGNGSPLLLLHGNGEDYHIFDQLIEKLKTGFTVYAIDSRNHGQSSITQDYAYETMAEDIRQFIVNLKLNQPSIVGFSDGAIISLLLARENNKLFHKMVLLGINLKPTDFKEDIYNYLVEEYEKTKDPLLRLMLEQPNIELSTLMDIHTPTLVIAGDNDLFRESLFEEIVYTMPNARLLIMKGHEHDSYIVGKDTLYPVLQDFLK